jgi:molybdopterin-guanine dinucleotide biosynthesis protein A
MDVIITAGGKPAEKEPLYNETRGGYKALLEIQGKPIIQWVLDAFSAAGLVDRVCVVGLPILTELTCSKPLTLLPDHGGMLENIRAGTVELFGAHPQDKKVLISASDIPAITPSMVDWMVNLVQQSDHDIYYNVIQRQIMETRYPGSRRSYLKLKDMEVCGGDLNAINASAVMDEKAIYRGLIDTRKNVLKQASLIGFDTLFFLLIRQLTLEEAVATVSKRLAIRARALVCPYAEIGMDVDKPGQLEMMRADLSPLEQ